MIYYNIIILVFEIKILVFFLKSIHPIKNLSLAELSSEPDSSTAWPEVAEANIEY
jgi:hypothetical protein